jgi:fatty-acyl-CoA synthase
LLAPIVSKLPTVRHFIVIARCQESRGSGQESGIAGHDYEALLEAENADFQLPDMDERSAAAMCYTSGTTGNPKGVVYSHRSICLHSMAVVSPSSFGLSAIDRCLVIPSMFHANAWGIPHAAWWVGSDLIFPGRFVQAEPLARLIAKEKPTFAGAVPTIWSDLVRHVEAHPVDLTSLRLCISGASAVPRSLIERLQKHGVRLVQIWGMTETSPLAALSHPPIACVPGSEEDIDWRTKTGRILHGIDLRITDGDQVLPWDGAAIGEIEVRGPWVTGSYYKDAAPEKFHDGWLRTGDLATVDPFGYMQITDRAKDVIKSGGEWVSSVELENHLMAHPDVIEAAVIAVPDERWDERPLACVVLKDDTATTLNDLRTFLAGRVVRWWLPERWSLIAEVPKTSVGKFDKKVLRQQFADGGLTVVVVEK